jgi:predicted transcriptional regulator
MQRSRRRGAWTTEGHRLLAKLFAADDAPSQHDVAESLGITQQSVSAYLRGFARPGELVRARFQKLYGIPASSWLTAKERAYAAATGTDG